MTYEEISIDIDMLTLIDSIYINGNFIFTGFTKNGDKFKHFIITSSDLKSFQAVEFFPNITALSAITIAYGNGIYFFASDRHTACYSKDLKNFNYVNINIPYSFNSVEFLRNRFIIVTGAKYSNNTYEGHVISSLDGVIWNDLVKLPYSLMDIAYGNKLYVIVGDGGYIATSTDLKNWTKRNSGTNLKLVGVSYGKDRFVVTGDNGIILTSTDGVIWTKQNSNTDNYLIRSCYANGLFFACGYNATLLISSDGINWENQLSDITGGLFFNVLFANNQLIVTSDKSMTTWKGRLFTFSINRDLSSSDDDCLFIFNKNLELLGIIDNFISLRWRRKFFEAGEYELVVFPTSYNLNLLTKKDNIIIRNNYTEAAIIEGYEINDDGDNIELNVQGHFLSYILKRRILKNTINFDGETIEGMKILLDNMSPFPNFEIESTSIVSPNISFQASYKNVYTYLVKLSKYSNVGFRVVPNIENKSFIFENYIGNDLTRNSSQNYIFSDDNFNIEKATLTYSSINSYNYALVGGVGEGENRIMKEVKNGDYNGFDLKEIFVDAKNQSNQNLSSAEYNNILNDLGKEKLQDDIFTFEATAYSQDYKKYWDLGDVVSIRKTNWNVAEEKRIIEVEEVIEDGIRSIYPVFGSPLPENINDKDD